MEKDSAMEQSTRSDAAEHIVDIQPSTMVDGLKIMEALSNEDSINLFFYAEKGIASSTEAIKALGMTQKRYYTRLKLLLEAGLLEKTDEGYQHTFMGRLVHKLGLSLLKIIENKEQLDVLNSIRKSSGISSETTSQIAKALSIELPLSLVSEIRDLPGAVKMIDSYDKLVGEITEWIGKSESSIYLASKYSDVKVVEAAMIASDRGVNLAVLVEEIDLSQSIQAIRILLSPKKLQQFIKFTKKLKNIVKKCLNLPYSFLVIDESITIIETPHPLKNEFQLAFVFENSIVGESFVKIFNEMWEKSSEFSIL